MATTVGELSVLLGADISGLTRGLGQAGHDLDRFAGTTESRLGRLSGGMMDLGRTMALGLTVPLVGLGVLATSQAVQFESAFAGVIKTVDATDAQLATLRAGILDMATDPTNPVAGLANAPVVLSQIAENAGALGVATGFIDEFTGVMAELDMSTDLTADSASTMSAQFANITGMDMGNIERFGSTIVDLGNSTASTESQILGMGLRISAAGTAAGMSVPQILGLGAALASVGLEEEAGGTAASRVINDITTAAATGGPQLQTYADLAGMTAEQFAAMQSSDPAAAFLNVVEGLGDLDAASQINVLHNLGLDDVRTMDTMRRLAGNSELLAQALGIATDAWAENNALSAEAHARLNTTAAQVEVLKNNFRVAGITIGGLFLPAVNKALGVFIPLVNRIIDANPAILKLGVIVGGAVAAFGPLMTVVGALLSPVGLAAGGVMLLATGVETLLSAGGTLGFFLDDAAKAGSLFATALDIAGDALAPLLQGKPVNMGWLKLSLQVAGEAVRQFATGLGENILQALENITGLDISGFAERTGTWISSAIDSAKITLDTLGDKINTALLSVGIDVSSIGEKISAGLASVPIRAQGLVTALMDGIRRALGQTVPGDDALIADLLPMPGESAMTALMTARTTNPFAGFISLLESNLRDAISGLGGLIDFDAVARRVLGRLRVAFQSLFSGGTPVVSIIGGGTGGVEVGGMFDFSALVSSVSTGITTAFKNLTGIDLGAVGDKINTAFAELRFNFEKALPAIAGALDTLLKNVSTWLTGEGIPTLSRAAGSLSGHLAVALHQAVTDAINSFSSSGGSAGQAGNSFIQAAQNMVVTPFQRGFNEAIAGTELDGAAMSGLGPAVAVALVAALASGLGTALATAGIGPVIGTALSAAIGASLFTVNAATWAIKFGAGAIDGLNVGLGQALYGLLTGSAGGFFANIPVLKTLITAKDYVVSFGLVESAGLLIGIARSKLGDFIKLALGELKLFGEGFSYLAQQAFHIALRVGGWVFDIADAATGGILSYLKTALAAWLPRALGAAGGFVGSMASAVTGAVATVGIGTVGLFAAVAALTLGAFAWATDYDLRASVGTWLVDNLGVDPVPLAVMIGVDVKDISWSAALSEEARMLSEGDLFGIIDLLTPGDLSGASVDLPVQVGIDPIFGGDDPTGGAGDPWGQKDGFDPTGKRMAGEATGFPMAIDVELTLSIDPTTLTPQIDAALDQAVLVPFEEYATLTLKLLADEPDLTMQTDRILKDALKLPFAETAILDLTVLPGKINIDAVRVAVQGKLNSLAPGGGSSPGGGGPGFDSGGIMPYTGLATLHAGERVLTRQETANYNRGAGGNGNTYIIYAGAGADGWEIADILKRTESQRGGGV